MRDARFGQPSILQHGHPPPRHRPLLTTPTWRAPPEVGDIEAEVPECRRIGRDGMISVEAHHHPPQPRSLRVDCLVRPSTQRLLDHLQLGAHPVAARLPLELETSSPAVSADVDEAKNVERLRFAETACPPVFGRMASELDEPCLPRVQRQGELRQAHPHFFPEPLGVGLMLEANGNVVSPGLRQGQAPRTMMTSPWAWRFRH
jgi:hypothetical protein